MNIPHVLAAYYDANGKVIWVSDGYVDRELEPLVQAQMQRNGVKRSFWQTFRQVRQGRLIFAYGIFIPSLHACDLPTNGVQPVIVRVLCLSAF